MDPLTAISLVTAAVKLFIEVEPILAKGFTNIKGYAVALYEKYTGHPITPEHRKILEDNIDVMHERFQRPVPKPENQ